MSNFSDQSPEDEDDKPATVMGRPPHVPSEEQRRHVKGMANRGIPHRHIAAIIGIHRETLMTHYRAELDEGLASGAVWTSNRIRTLAESGHWGALKQMASVYLDWNDKVDVKHTGADGKDLKIFLTMSEEDLRKRQAELDEALSEE